MFVARHDRHRLRRRPLALVSAVVAAVAIAAPAAAQTAAPPDPPKRAAFRLVDPATGSSLAIRGLIQADAVYFPDDAEDDNTNGIAVRRVRLRLDGSLFGHFDYRFHTELANNAVDVLDAYIEAGPTPALRFRIGKGKAPLSLDRLVGSTDVLMYERSYPANFAPNRDIGAQVLGDLAGGTLAYAIGAFDGAPDGGSVTTDIDDRLEAVGRVFVRPFRRGSRTRLRDLGVGAAFSAGRTEGSTAATGLSSYRTSGRATFFRYASGAFADGDRRRVDLSGYYYAGRFGAMAEWIHSAHQVRRDDVSARVAHDAWNVSTSFALTDDRPAYNGIVPRTILSRSAGTVGALELTARVQGADFDPDVFALGFANPAQSVRRALAWTVGLNWSLNPNARVQINFERTTFDGGSAAGDRAPENAILSRLNLFI